MNRKGQKLLFCIFIWQLIVHEAMFLCPSYLFQNLITNFHLYQNKEIDIELTHLDPNVVRCDIYVDFQPA